MKPASGNVPIVTLYTSASCTLCKIAEAELRALAERLLFRLELVPVDQAEGGRDLAYRDAIPVVELAEVEIARAPIRRGTLERRLLAALQRSVG